MTPIPKEITGMLVAIRAILSAQELKVLRFIPEKELPSTDPHEVGKYLGEAPAVFYSREMDTWLTSMEKMKDQSDSFLYLEKIGLVGVTKNLHRLDRVLANLKGSGSASVHPDMEYQSEGTESLRNKVVMITGAAQGMGEGIARHLFRLGSQVVLCDINEKKGDALAEELNGEMTHNRALFVKTDVSRFSSVESAVKETVLHFGSVDVMISNAGILQAGGIDEMDPETFERVTRVNYSGFFHCVRSVAPVMKIQNSYRSGTFTDIIQINSKSGLTGSKKNFAYAGSKFGGIGLTQSFALELINDSIKVNAICPGNFFEGPLWSDPDNGLFVQYLKAGKVPGAKSLEDVKRYYESMVPAGRGCRVEDVVRAIVYVIEQEYETGQAIPVTGGQEMLH